MFKLVFQLTGAAKHVDRMKSSLKYFFYTVTGVIYKKRKTKKMMLSK